MLINIKINETRMQRRRINKYVYTYIWKYNYKKEKVNQQVQGVFLLPPRSALSLFIYLFINQGASDRSVIAQYPRRVFPV